MPPIAACCATGVRDDDFRKPFIAICNSYTDIIPGHVHLDKVGEFVKQCVREAGGVPFVFNTIGVDDGIAMGHGGMKFSLPSRELIADCVETMLQAHCFDGMICIPNCDKIVPGMLMAAVRCNIPTIFVSGGPMEAGKTPDGKTVDLIDVFVGAAAKQQTARSRAEELLELEKAGCPTCGSCSGMFTANSMNCLCEALGMALPSNGTLLATSAERKRLFRRAAQRIVEMVLRVRQAGAGHGLLPREIVTAESIDNAMILDMAMGGSTNTVLHMLAIAHEAGVAYDIERINELSQQTPNICKVAPSSQLPRRGRPQRGRHPHDPRQPSTAAGPGCCTSIAPPSPARRWARTSPTTTSARARSAEEALELAAVTAGGTADHRGNERRRARPTSVRELSAEQLGFDPLRLHPRGRQCLQPGGRPGRSSTATWPPRARSSRRPASARRCSGTAARR